MRRDTDARLWAQVPGGESYFGNTRLEILEQMKESGIFVAEKSIEEYLDFLVDSAKRYYDIDLVVEGDSVDERAESLTRALERHDLMRVREMPRSVEGGGSGEGA